jgi:hypothetical protein
VTEETRAYFQGKYKGRDRNEVLRLLHPARKRLKNVFLFYFSEFF